MSNILLVGSGAREHALAWKLSVSQHVKKIWVSPGNGGTDMLSDLSITDFIKLSEWCNNNSIDLVVVGPEAPLAEGIGDVLEHANIACFGPSKRAAMIESSKAFAKDFMHRHGIPTARFEVFTDAAAACRHIRSAPYKALVVKASGLAAGKGVHVARDADDACAAVNSMMRDRSLGAAGECVVVEELLEGEEVSVMCFTDGTQVELMPPAQDHKRQLDADLGPNTGGMGAYAPCPFVSDEQVEWVREHVLQRAVDGLRAEGRTFRGVLYAGLMMTRDGPRVLEFNCRFGDPEAQVVLPLLETDLYPTLLACAQPITGQRSRPTLAQVRPRFSRTRVCLGVTLASAGYPGDYRRGVPIAITLAKPDTDADTEAGPSSSASSSRSRSVSASSVGAGDSDGLLVFHGGTRLQPSDAHAPEASGAIGADGALLQTNGGRVFTAIALADIDGRELVLCPQVASLVARLPFKDGTAAALFRAWRRAMQLVNHVRFEGKQFRSDIGLRAIVRGLPPDATRVCIYAGPGTCGLRNAIATFVEAGCHLRLLGPAEVIEGSWIKDTDVFFMPGGQSRAFEGALHPEGARVLREFVSARGGLYVGVCAGSYFGASSYAFDRGGPLQVLEPEPEPEPERAAKHLKDSPASAEAEGKKEEKKLREARLLCFHPGCATGPVLAPYDYTSNKGARVARVRTGDGRTVCLFHSGGCEFSEVSGGGGGAAEAVARYADVAHAPAAIVRVAYGRGTAVLSGPHIEYGHALLDARDPHLAPLLPSLREHDAARRALLEHILDFAPNRLNKRKSTAPNSNGGLTYEQSGVSVHRNDTFVDAIKEHCKRTDRVGCMSGIGSFGALFELAPLGYRDPILVSGTDGVGSKLLIAEKCNDYSTVGIDLVAMCVNDILAHGAEPLFFLDYYAVHQIELGAGAAIIASVADGCKQANCALVGGETAELPSILRERSQFDLAGFAVGVVDRDQVLPRTSSIQPGDVVVGLASSGLHSNGFSLVRLLVDRKYRSDYSLLCPFGDFGSKRTLGEELLTPTTIYVRTVLPLLRRGLVKGYAHITGGGLVGNIPRVLPNGVYVRLDANKWTIPPVFTWLQVLGNISEIEMLQTFNCGIGAALVVSPSDVSAVLEHLHAEQQTAALIGVVERATEPDSEPIVIVENIMPALERNRERISFSVPTPVDESTETATIVKPKPPGAVAIRPKVRVGVLISGSGSNLQALIDWAASPNHQSAYEIALVVSNVSGVQGLTRAQKAGIPTIVVDHKQFVKRAAFDERVDAALREAGVEWVCLAGFMRILGAEFVRSWAGRLLNIHPSLLPSFRGAHAHSDALAAGVSVTGATVHFVAPEVDAGAVIAQRSAFVHEGDTEEILAERVKAECEHVIYPRALELAVRGRVAMPLSSLSSSSPSIGAGDTANAPGAVMHESAVDRRARWTLLTGAPDEDALVAQLVRQMQS